MAIGRYRTPEQFDERSGELHERFLFGAVRTGDPAYLREKNALIQHYRDLKQAVPLDKALEVVKHFQPFKPDSREMVDAANPVKQFPYAIRKYVADKLGLEEKDSSRVLFWTAVGSLIDTGLQRGVAGDAVLEIRGGLKEPARLMLVDVTRRSPEETLYKYGENPDRIFIHGEIPDPQEDKAKFDAMVREAGDEIVEKLKAQKAVAGRAA